MIPDCPARLTNFLTYSSKETIRFQHRFALQGWATRFITTHEVHEATATTGAILLLFSRYLHGIGLVMLFVFCWCCAMAITLLASGIGTYS